MGIETSLDLSERKMERLKKSYDDSLQLVSPIFDIVNGGGKIAVDDGIELGLNFKATCRIESDAYHLPDGPIKDAFIEQVRATSRSIQDIMNSVEA